MRNLSILLFTILAFLIVFYIYNSEQETEQKPTSNNVFEVVDENIGSQPPIVRDWNRDTVVYADKNTSTFSTNQINWKASTGWRPIVMTPNASSTGFSVEEYPAKLYFPLYADGNITVINDKRFSVKTKTDINETEFSEIITLVGANHATGTVTQEDYVSPFGRIINANITKYEEAYTGVDLLLVAHNGTEPFFEKILKFDSAPTELNYSFDVCYSEQVTILPTQSIEKGKGVDVASNATSRGISMLPFKIWDSAGSSTDIDVTRQNLGQHCYRFTKELPQSFFDSATYPVYTDITSNFNSSSGAASPVDGDISHETSTGSTWVTAHDATTGTGARVTGTADQCVASEERAGQSSLFLIQRSFFLFDTSSLSGQVVSSSSFNIYTNYSNDNDNDGDDTLALYEARPDQNDNLTTSDYYRIEDTALTEVRDMTTIESEGESQRHSWLLNATGNSFIKTTGITKFAMREGHDVGGTSTPIATDTINQFGCNWADNGTDIPFLIVDHDAAPAAAPTGSGTNKRRGVMIILKDLFTKNVYGATGI